MHISLIYIFNDREAGYAERAAWGTVHRELRTLKPLTPLTSPSSPSAVWSPKPKRQDVT